MVKASIVIVSWNGSQLLQRGLPSVLQALDRTPGQHEVIVVDDGSQDDTLEMLRQRFPAVKTVALDANQGFGAACNQGVAQAAGDVVIMLNNDMVVEPDFLGFLLAPFAQDQELFAVACCVKKADRQTVELARTAGVFKLGFLKVLRQAGATPPAGLCPALYGSGGAVAYDKGKFLQLGGFDPLYHPFYWEDTDLSYRAWRRGWRVCYQPQSIVYHEHQATIGKSFPRAYIRRINYRNRFLFMWSNIRDRGWLLQHALFLPAYLLLYGASGRWFYLRGFWDALARWAEVRRRRRTHSGDVYSDEDILRLSGREEGV